MTIKPKQKILFVVVGIILYMCLGTIYSWSIFRKPLESLLNIGSTESGLPYMVFLVSYALSMPLVGGFIDKYGPKIITLIGGLVFSAAWILSSQVSSVGMLTFTYGVIGGIGVGIVYGAPMAVAAKWFPAKKGVFVGLTLAGFGLSPFVTAPVSKFLIEKYSLFEAFKILGLVFLGLVILLALLLRFPEAEEVEEPTSKSVNNASDNLSLSEVLKNSRFYILWMAFTIGTFSGLIAIGISSPVAQEMIGLDSTMSSLAVALFAIFNGLGRPFFGWLTDKFQFQKTALISFSLIAFASLIMFGADKGSVAIYLLAFCLFWFLFGGWLAIAPTAVSQAFGAKNYARNYGVLFTAYGVGAFLGSLVSGFIKDSFGSYHYVFYATAVAAVMGLVMAVLSNVKGSKEPDSEREYGYENS